MFIYTCMCIVYTCVLCIRVRQAKLGPGNEETEPHQSSNNCTAQLLTGCQALAQIFHIRDLI